MARDELPPIVPPEGELAGTLDVLAVLSDAQALSELERVLAECGDRLTLAQDLDEALARISSEAPDAALVDVSFGEDGRGIPIVERARALSPRTAVFAVAPESRSDLSEQVCELECAGLLTMPFSAEDLRAALLGLRGSGELTEPAAPPACASKELVLDLFEIGEAASLREASERLAKRLASALSATRVVIYLAASDDARQLLRTAVLGCADGAPAFGIELELLDYANHEQLSVLRFATRRESIGFALLGGVAAEQLLDEDTALLGAVATLALALAGARERSHRAAIKDPESSAYTFSYFVDVAGREIDMARRHGRRFALATITVRAARDGKSAARREPTLEAAERVLAAVRDTDVLARVDENEFYLLLPETGRIGAIACQRRVHAAFRVGSRSERLELSMGLSTFPHDGTDLSRLLRVARHRAESSARSVTESFGLRELPFTELVDTLLGQVSMLGGGASPEFPRYIELPVMDAIGVAIGVLREAVRGGEARIVATRHAGMSIGGAVRAEIVRDVEGARLDVVDVSSLPGAENVDVLAVVGQHALYGLIGRSESGLVRAVHTSDPALVDLLFERLADGAVGKWPER